MGLDIGCPDLEHIGAIPELVGQRKIQKLHLPSPAESGHLRQKRKSEPTWELQANLVVC